jgi:hypothetical protein
MLIDLDWWHIGAGGVLVLALTAILGSLMHGRRLKRRVLEQEALLRSLERDMQGICLGARGMGETVARLEKRLHRLTERQDSLDLRDAGRQPYHYAITLAQRGAGVEDLVRRCGLTPGEAELLHLLHREVPRSSSTDAA